MNTYKRVWYVVVLLFVAFFTKTFPVVADIILESSLPKEPAWYDTIIKQEGAFIFVVGHSQPQPTLQEARDDALARAVEEIVKYSGVTVESFARSVEVVSMKSGEVSEKLENLPPEVKFPVHLRDRISYDKSQKLLIFKGVMSEKEKKELLALSENKQYKKAIEAIFQKSPGSTYYTSDFTTQSIIRAKAFVKRATPLQWYDRKMTRTKADTETSEYYLSSVYLRVPEEEIERIQEEKDIKLSLDIGIYYEDEEGKLCHLTEGNILHSGDAYTLYVRPSDECYLYIFQIDDLGHSYMLFPSEEYHTSLNPLKAGQDYWIPNAEHCFVLDEIIGQERLYLFASPDKIIEFEAGLSLQQADFDQVVKTMGVRGVKEKLNPYKVESSRQNQLAEVKKKLQAEGAFVYETWFWHE